MSSSCSVRGEVEVEEIAEEVDAAMHDMKKNARRRRQMKCG